MFTWSHGSLYSNRCQAPCGPVFADINLKFVPKFRDKNERLQLIANNPVASAHFFEMMVDQFIEQLTLHMLT